ncbi:hypothetical protein ACFLZV_00675 [Candidatus Margulisiibacteriota bacterium]
MARKFSIFDSEHNFTPDVKEVAFDPGISSRFKTLENYFKSSKIRYNPEELQKLRIKINKDFYQQVKRLCLLVYVQAEKSEDWGDAGEQYAKVSFFKCLMKVKPNEKLTQETAWEAEDKVQSSLAEFGLSDLTEGQAKKAVSDYSFNILGRKFSADNPQKINEIISFLGVKYMLQGGKSGDSVEYILFTGKKSYYNAYEVILIEKEYLRTHTVIVPLAALVAENTVYIRQECLETMFYGKWLILVQDDQPIISKAQDNIYFNISAGMRAKTISLYKAQDEESFLKIKNTFLKDMRETVMFHEFGHGFTEYNLLSLENSAVLDATGVFEQNIFPTLLEVLSDFCAGLGAIKGPFKNIVDIAKKDKARAERMFYMYLADVWFFDTTKEFMYLYTIVMILILLRYIDEDQKIDFKKLEEDINTQDTKESLKDNILKLLIDNCKQKAEILKDMVMKTNFNLSDGAHSFHSVKELTHENFVDNKVSIDKESGHYHSEFWGAMMSYVSLLSNNGGKFKKYLDDTKSEILQLLLPKEMVGKAQAAAGFDYKGYIVQEMKKRGLFYLDDRVSFSDTDV